jgi:hypothetical protein
MREVHERDEQGRPIDVTFDGDPARQCPGCLGTNLDTLALGFVPVGDEREPTGTIRRMRCLDCGAGWFRPGP